MNDLEILARNVNKQYAINKNLQKKLTIYKQYFILTKEIMKKTMQNKNNSTLSIFSQYSDQIIKDCNNLKIDIKTIRIKYDSILEECRSDLTMGKPILAQKRNEDFSNEFKIIEKNDIINTLRQSIKSSKNYRLFREPKRESFVDLKKGNKEMENLQRDIHQNMLYNLKKCNKCTHKIKKYELKKESIKKNIELLNNYMKSKDLKASNFEILTKNNEKKKTMPFTERNNNLLEIGKHIDNDNDINNSDDDKRNKKNEKLKNKIIKEFKKIEDILNISEEEGESEEIIDEELHSDDDTFFENKIKITNKISKQYLKNIKSSIPALNLKQIEFNSQKKDEEIDLYSLERRKYKNKNVNGQIKDMKAKIEKISKKLTLLKRKENQMREFAKKIKKNYESIKPIIFLHSEVNIMEGDFILNSLNKETKNTTIEKNKKLKSEEKFDDLDNIKEDDEINYNGNEENEKSDDKKETKDTKKEDEFEEIKMEKNINLKTDRQKIPHFIKKKKKQKNRNILISFNPKTLKNNINNDPERPKSK